MSITTDKNLEDDERFMPAAELAAMLDVSNATLVRWRRLKEGPTYVRIGNKCCYRVRDVKKWIADNTTVCE